MSWADLDEQTKNIYLRQAGGDEAAAAALYAEYLNGSGQSGLPNGTQMPTGSELNYDGAFPETAAAADAPASRGSMPSAGIAGGYGSQNYGAAGPAPGVYEEPYAPPPVSAPPPVGGSAGSSSYTSGGGSGGSYQATPMEAQAPVHQQSDWSRALHASGALQNPRANPIPFEQAPGANTGAFDPYLRNTQGQAGAGGEVGGGVPPVSMPPMPGMGPAQAPDMTNFDPGAPKLGDAAPVAQGNTFGSPTAPSPAPATAPVAPPQMTPEEIRLRYGQMNRGMEQSYGRY